MGRDGWLGVGWPPEYGGRGLGQVEQQIFVSEAARADVPLPAVTLQTVGPVLQAHGTAGQKEFFLPRILAGEVHFAIGYTEPEAGTDLASLRTRAVRDGGHLRGQRGEDLHHRRPRRRLHLAGLPHRPRTRLDTRASPSSSWTPPTRGSRWTPIITHDGAHHTNATYYSDVRVPVTMRVGEENAGWRLITTQLNHERVMLGPAGRLAALYDRVRGWADRAGLAGPARRSAGAGADLRQPADQRAAQLAGRGGATASEIADASVTKVFASERLQQLGQLLEELVGRHGDPADEETAELCPLAGYSGQTKHRADLRRWGQRDPAGTDRHGRPRAAAGAPLGSRGEWTGR